MVFIVLHPFKVLLRFSGADQMPHLKFDQNTVVTFMESLAILESALHSSRALQSTNDNQFKFHRLLMPFGHPTLSQLLAVVVHPSDRFDALHSANEVNLRK
ncbi:hypothetical protein BST95_05395 [Halioglobus japonicus]|uniref:Uncharacterized protein n=1 Tax=Halioglobus japonicus TaxID=930805 RepID=A0AAP8MDU1_9GAMM|nr:hypothetical protein BST95_05395 [Halioglobus japonicus]PLW85702.1 hypothetical protein C0029_13945 [Halioglobus japonicus]